MPLVRTLLVLVSALALLANAEANTKPKPSMPKIPRPKTTKPRGPKQPASNTPHVFQGEVVKVQATTPTQGNLWVKHANGALKHFHVSPTTAVSGANVGTLGAITKGSLVSVQATKSNAMQINVATLAPPVGNQQAQGAPLTGVVTKVTSDSFGDTGQLWVKPANGPVVQLQVTNATNVDYKHGKHTDVHSLQFVAKGQHVTVASSGGVALQIDVIGSSKK